MVLTGDRRTPPHHNHLCRHKVLLKAGDLNTLTTVIDKKEVIITVIIEYHFIKKCGDLTTICTHQQSDRQESRGRFRPSPKFSSSQDWTLISFSTQNLAHFPAFYGPKIWVKPLLPLHGVQGATFPLKERQLHGMDTNVH